MRVFLSYTHDDSGHVRAVAELARLLAANGIEPVYDQIRDTERIDWYPWATGEMLATDYVLVIASQRYREMGDGLGPAGRNLGGQAEAAILRDLVQGDRPRWTRRILPVLLPGHTIGEIPLFLQPYAATRYVVDPLTQDGAVGLLRVLTGQPAHLPPPLGPVPVLPPADW